MGTKKKTFASEMLFFNVGNLFVSKISEEKGGLLRIVGNSEDVIVDFRKLSC